MMKKKILLLCLFCLIFFVSYAQNATVTNKSTTTICTSDKTSLIQSPEMKKVWRSSFVKAIVVQPEVNLESLIRLKNLLSIPQVVYNPKNTLIICNDENVTFVKEAAVGYTVLVMTSFGNATKSIFEGTITPVTNKVDDGNYDFKFVQSKML